MVEKRELPPTGILQEWVAELGLRHQGVLMTVIRGCDTVPKEHPSKDLTRALRGLLLNTHCANPTDAVSFIEAVSVAELTTRYVNFLKSIDDYPLHFFMHITHATEVIGYHHPDADVAKVCRVTYRKICKKLHVNPETKKQLDERLSMEETAFGKAQHKG